MCINIVNDRTKIQIFSEVLSRDILTRLCDANFTTKENDRTKEYRQNNTFHLTFFVNKFSAMLSSSNFPLFCDIADHCYRGLHHSAQFIHLSAQLIYSRAIYF